MTPPAICAPVIVYCSPVPLSCSTGKMTGRAVFWYQEILFIFAGPPNSQNRSEAVHLTFRSADTVGSAFPVITLIVISLATLRGNLAALRTSQFFLCLVMSGPVMGSVFISIRDISRKLISVLGLATWKNPFTRVLK